MNHDALLAARLRTLARLSGSVGHAIRGASSTLSVHIQLLTASAGDTESRARYLAAMAQSHRRLQQLIDTFLERVALPEPSPSPVPLAALLTGVVELAEPEYAGGRVQLDAHIDGGSLRVAGEHRWVCEQVLLDLLVVLIDAAAPGDTVEIHVPDPTRATVILRTARPIAAGGFDALAATHAMLTPIGGSAVSTADGEVLLELPASSCVG